MRSRVSVGKGRPLINSPPSWFIDDEQNRFLSKDQKAEWNRNAAYLWDMNHEGKDGISYVVWRLAKHLQLSLEVCHQLKTDATSLTLWTNRCSCPLTIIRRSILVDIIRKWRLVVVVVIIVVLISWMIISHRCISGEQERTDEFKLVSNGFHDLEDEMESIQSITLRTAELTHWHWNSSTSKAFLFF